MYSKMIPLLVISILISAMILEGDTEVRYYGAVLYFPFFFITFAFYLTFRKKENTENINRYVRGGIALITHGIGATFIGTSMMISGILVGIPMLLASILITYEGWRAMNGYDLFIPNKSSPKKLNDEK